MPVGEIDKSISDYEITMKFGLQHPIFSFEYRRRTDA
jgi:hypothetical protein